MNNNNSLLVSKKNIDNQSFYKEKSNKKMMILSFLGILFVVFGHITDFKIDLMDGLFPYYSFHMCLFIFISGYFYKPEYEKNICGKKGYIIKKIRRLLIPYFIWNLIYGIILFLIKKAGIVTFGSDINFKSLFVEPWTIGHQFILNLVSWFMLALFLVNIIYIIVRKLFTKMKLWNDYVATFIFLIISVAIVYISKTKVNIDINQMYIPITRTLFFLFFYQFGYLYKTKLENKFKINTVIYFLLLIMIQLIVIKLDGKISYNSCYMQFDSKFYITPILVSLTGILFWTKVSQILVPAIGNSKIVNYISSNTYDIMLHHLFCFFMLNLFALTVCNILNRKGFELSKFKDTIYYFYTAGVEQSKIIYAIVGISMPLICRYIYEKIKFKCKKKYILK